MSTLISRKESPRKSQRKERPCLRPCLRPWVEDLEGRALLSGGRLVSLAPLPSANGIGMDIPPHVAPPPPGSGPVVLRDQELPPGGGGFSLDAQVYCDKLLDEINRERAAYHLPPATVVPFLQQFAQDHIGQDLSNPIDLSGGSELMERIRRDPSFFNTPPSVYRLSGFSGEDLSTPVKAYWQLDWTSKSPDFNPNSYHPSGDRLYAPQLYLGIDFDGFYYANSQFHHDWVGIIMVEAW